MVTHFGFSSEMQQVNEKYKHLKSKLKLVALHSDEELPVTPPSPADRRDTGMNKVQLV